MTLPPGGLSWTPAQRAVRSGCSGLCRARGSPRDPCELGQLFGATERREQQSGNAEVYVEVFPMESISARAQLDRRELFRRGLRKIDTGFRGKAEEVSVGEFHHDAATGSLIARGRRASACLALPLLASSSGRQLGKNIRKWRPSFSHGISSSSEAEVPRAPLLSRMRQRRPDRSYLRTFGFSADDRTRSAR